MTSTEIDEKVLQLEQEKKALLKMKSEQNEYAMVDKLLSEFDFKKAVEVIKFLGNNNVTEEDLRMEAKRLFNGIISFQNLSAKSEYLYVKRNVEIDTIRLSLSLNLFEKYCFVEK
jgi:hypothetical protein